MPLSKAGFSVFGSQKPIFSFKITVLVFNSVRYARHYSPMKAYITFTRHEAASITFCSKSNQVCIKRFCRLYMPQRFVSCTHCYKHPKFYNLQVHFDTFDAIFFGNILL